MTNYASDGIIDVRRKDDYYGFKQCIKYNHARNGKRV